MKKGRWSSWVSNDLLNYIFIILSVILLFKGLLAIRYTLRLYEQAEAKHLTIKVSWWFNRVMNIAFTLTFALWLGLSWYKDRLRKKLESIKCARQMRWIVNAFWWTTVLFLVVVAARFWAAFYQDSGEFIFSFIILPIMATLLIYGLTTSREEWGYFRKQPLCNIAAACLLEKGRKFLDLHDFEKAHDAFLKACETAPEGTFLWCHLAHFCELFNDNTTETDMYMAKAEELISTKKAESNSDKACYFNYLGDILYRRGEYEKGLEYMKQSIDIEPNPGRIKTYEEKLSEFNAKQQNAQQ